MIYKIILSKNAEKYCMKQDVNKRNHIYEAIEYLRMNPSQGNNIKKLSGKLNGYYRYRQGTVRIIYEIFEKEIMVYILKIGNRGDVYK